MLDSKSVWMFVTAACLAAVGLSQLTSAQEYAPSRVDAFSASAEAKNHFNARRLQGVRDQIGLIDQIKWYNGFPTSAVNPYPYSPSVDYLYGVGGTRYYGGRSIFEPWPYVPGDIWGYRWFDPAPQPIGQRQVQTGPGRWESYPIYLSPPPAISPTINAPPANPVRPESAIRGPRQF